MNIQGHTQNSQNTMPRATHSPAPAPPGILGSEASAPPAQVPNLSTRASRIPNLSMQTSWDRRLNPPAPCVQLTEETASKLHLLGAEPG
eukprot:CAMPEP_0184324508 /NCGR_PEP_ID=MMETSP1049-20130417/135532_1 /TAXON_ID=77928 /ORGANISM="Proteomonas sulcata, Strain CCMP704" /LENGTH=88 /DNA_ID=CAMNT_0026646289 /DNA_START=74 /DNA_END=337 /DNA_ORIENTATION=-